MADVTAGVIGIKITGDSSELQSELQNAGRKVQDFGGKVSEQSDTVQKLAGSLKNAFVGSGIAAGVIYLKSVVGDATQAIVQAQIQVDKLRNGMNFAVGRDKSAGELEFVRQAAHSLGLEVVGTSLQYTKLAAASRGTNLEGQKTRDIFNAIAQASVVMGLSAEDNEGALRAVVQMISKGKVQAEELRGQLGERLPGAFQIAARAMGVTTAELDKMLETGQVLASDFLPKFAKQLSSEVAPEVDAASKSMQVSITNLGNAWTNLKQKIATSGISDVIKSGIDRQTIVLDMVTKVFENASGQNPIYEAAKAVTELDRRATILRNGMAMGFYGPQFQGELDSVNAKLAVAKQRFRDLDAAIRDGKSSGTATSRGITAQGEARTAYLEQRARDQAAVEAMRIGVSGQSAAFQSKLREAQRLRENGSFGSDSEYASFIADLIKKEGGVEKPKGGGGSVDTAQRLAEMRLGSQAVQENIEQLKQKLVLEKDLQALKIAAAAGAVTQDYFVMRRAQIQNQELDAQEAALRNQLAAAKAAEQSAKREDDKIQALTKRLGIEKNLAELAIRRVQIDDGEADRQTAARKKREEEAEAERKRLEQLQRAGIAKGQELSEQARQMRESMLPNAQQAVSVLARESEAMRRIVDVHYASSEEARKAWDGFYDWFAERSNQLALQFVSGADSGIQAYLRSIQDAGRFTSEAAQRAAQNMEGGILDALKGSSAGIKRFVAQAVDDLLTLRVVRPIMNGLLGTSGGAGGFGSSIIQRLFGGGFSMDPTAIAAGPMTESQMGATFASQFGQYATPLAVGMPYVPYDNFPALLHRGERVLTADENRSGGSGPAVVQNITFNGGVSRTEVVAGMQQARQLAVADMLEGQARRRF